MSEEPAGVLRDDDPGPEDQRRPRQPGQRVDGPREAPEMNGKRVGVEGDVHLLVGMDVSEQVREVGRGDAVGQRAVDALLHVGLRRRAAATAAKRQNRTDQHQLETAPLHGRSVGCEQLKSSAQKRLS